MSILSILTRMLATLAIVGLFGAAVATPAKAMDDMAVMSAGNMDCGGPPPINTDCHYKPTCIFAALCSAKISCQASDSDFVVLRFAVATATPLHDDRSVKSLPSLPLRRPPRS
jgi:hypothetical protein